ncbi:MULTISPECIES: tRNA (adenosine(37)-N6)-dimethylallyltransferase MiaA [unclassified Duganella]|uniref:tRNA (adenosine(37)-N6)-dimethylallyltransferase MiaA n=1 Tax=unclassified Duganella TaxID=2636909 RepID=UPI0006FEC57D|nr:MULTISPECIES: tRNA (adenosine(37)-N6)-dimethylallyltransferase MiaA [unclassified Duganella]KQV53831.1 tRNA dimethylallyltransferase [Duganella sp. Root336D2]KRB83616.1 tRNA dimethylallyltransferase [Duganella sp. Root198D2]
MNEQSNKRPLAVAIMGPTASGKTAVALAIAQQVPCEIISVDSALVYRGMDIGTAKPSKEELAAVPHHLIDIIDPLDSYSVAQFRTDTLRLVAEISARGKVPLLVGGTMLYYKGLADGLDELPGADAVLRAQLDEEAARIGWPAMHARLAQIDPATAARLKPNDSQRVQRALEIHALSGKPMSELLAQREKEELPFDLLSYALEPSDRAWLHQRIARRFDIMLDSGFLDEVNTLRARGDLHPGLPSIRCVGYRQAWEYMDGSIDYAAMRETGIIATRQLCKRQLTWLRSMPERIMVDCCAPDASEQLQQQVLANIARAKTSP